jgi:ABC-type Mn2+/Zn2+ transport system ATPase subunit
MNPDRFVITSLRVKSFKSFASTITLQLPKHYRIVALIGANGAGAITLHRAVAAFIPQAT